MDRITVDQPLTTQLESAIAPVEVVDKTGRPLGHFVPRPPAAAPAACPYAPDALVAMRAEQGGRPLAEIWRSLR
ncbi:MAG: hypothetical protein ABSG86_03855 [Thermoguttaceae bacterium]|jgi:hypothetical protein